MPWRSGGSSSGGLGSDLSLAPFPEPRFQPHQATPAQAPETLGRALGSPGSWAQNRALRNPRSSKCFPKLLGTAGIFSLVQGISPHVHVFPSRVLSLGVQRGGPPSPLLPFLPLPSHRHLQRGPVELWPPSPSCLLSIGWPITFTPDPSSLPTCPEPSLPAALPLLPSPPLSILNQQWGSEGQGRAEPPLPGPPEPPH